HLGAGARTFKGCPAAGVRWKDGVMSQNRPWNRPEFTQAPAGDFDFADASDDEVRSYCLQRSRTFLARAESTDAAISSNRQLEIASQYAMIAQAFRVDLEVG
ncbi:hypothetical protein ACWD7F_36970, partial [Streptomyces sp. NPDC005122]